MAKVVYNFGRAAQLDADRLLRLAASILRVVSSDVTSGAGPSGGTDDLRIRDSWTYGGVHVLEELWKEVGIGAVLTARAKRVGAKQPFERALFAMVANRALEPYSKLFCWEQWLREDVFLPSAAPLELHHLYWAMDFLEEHKAEVEKAVFFRMADLMNADVDLIFYDTTSLHFEVDEEDEITRARDDRQYEPLRKRGYSKSGRDDARRSWLAWP